MDGLPGNITCAPGCKIYSGSGDVIAHDCNNNLIRGAFIWGVSAIGDYDCNHIVFGIYCKPSAETVKQVYEGWKITP